MKSKYSEWFCKKHKRGVNPQKAHKCCLKKGCPHLKKGGKKPGRFVSGNLNAKWRAR